MTLPGSGALSFSDIRTEFGGGSSAISLRDGFARGGSKVPISSTTVGIGNTNESVSVSQFYGTQNALDVDYELIGGGGGGGRGTGDRPAEAYRCRSDTPYAGATGGTSTLKNGATTIASAAGGAGGVGQCESQTSASCWTSSREYAGCPGENSYYGSGGGKAAANTHGKDAGSSAYGAGGGGAGGDDYDTYDEPGYPGMGGDAGTRVTGTVVIPNGTTLTLTGGALGAGATGATYNGGDGGKGYVKITYPKYTNLSYFTSVIGVGANKTVSW